MRDAEEEGVYEMAEGYSFSDDDTAYYPGYGTIYDYDFVWINSDLEEKIQTGIGPVYYYKYTSYMDYSYSVARTWRITLTGVETGADVDFFTFDVNGGGRCPYRSCR